MNRNSLLALATLIALLWIESGDCKTQNDYEVDIAKRQKSDPTCETLKYCENYCSGIMTKPEHCMAGCAKITQLEVYENKKKWQKKCGIFMGRRALAEMADEDEADEDEDEADEDEADEAKSDEVDIAKRQKGLKILKAWKRDEAEMADVDQVAEARSDKAQNQLQSQQL